MEKPVITPAPTIEDTVKKNFEAGYNGQPDKSVGSAVSGAASTVSDTASKVGGGISGAVKTIGDKAKSIWGDIDVCSILGGIGGGILAWLCGSFMGDGWIGTALTICLVPALAIIGADKGGNWLRGMFGYDKPNAGGPSPSVDGPAATPTVTLAPPTITAVPPAVTAAPPVATLPPTSTRAAGPAFTQPELDAMLDNARKAGNTRNTVGLIRSGDALVADTNPSRGTLIEGNMTADKVREDFAQCRALTGTDSALMFSPTAIKGRITPHCVPMGKGGSSTPSR